MKKTMIITGTLLLVILFGIVAILQHPAFGRSPRPERLARILQSPNYRDNQFQNQNHTPVTTAEGGRLKTLWDFMFGMYKIIKIQHVKKGDSYLLILLTISMQY